jgi:acetyl-CoA acetyltransferase
VRGLEQSLELRPVWHCGARETPGQSGSIVDAMVAVASGLCRHVLCLNVVDESAESPGGVEIEPVRETPQSCVPARTSPIQRTAFACSEYLKTFGHTRQSLGWVAIAARRHANENADARDHLNIRMEDYLAAEIVSDPLGVADYGRLADGTIAIVVSEIGAARQRGPRPVRVDAVGTRQIARNAGLSLAQYRLLSEAPAAHMWSRASVTKECVSFVALDDTFTFDVVCWLEALGFCGPGKALRFVEGGIHIGPGGELPVNPHGGRLAAGYGGAYGNIYETMTQLRGRAEGRQIPDARVAVAAGSGDRSGCAMVLIRDV